MRRGCSTVHPKQFGAVLLLYVRFFVCSLPWFMECDNSVCRKLFVTS